MSMPKAALAAVAVLVLAVSGLMLLGRSAELPGAVGAPASPSPSPTATATAAPTASPAPSEIAPGITGWTAPLTSEVYGVTLSLPDGWRQVATATHKWPPVDQADETIFDTFLNADRSVRDGDQIAMLVYQRPAGSGEDITSREGLAAWVQANLCGESDPGHDPAQACEYVVEPMCIGRTACLPAILVSDPGSVVAIIPNAETGLVTIVQLGRGPDFPATAGYGGGVQLVKSILTTMDVWTPEPGQLPSGG
jgi:hypothetical protein